ncbi:hypothetical protein NIES2100_05450 [Calothrix sp. NIES-2100]|uniref:glycosyl hydrolase family 28-related protein n=1 Tax=Calothrix sp. NIES-2100 TaxID=1954172 RepID=UPI000B5F9D72|nr:hypothetical protein NIES2100_05450 [Calothrix sp. NIES-2100]
MAENIIFPNNANLLIPRNFTINGQNYTATINLRTGQPFNIDNTGATDVSQEMQDFLDCKMTYGGNRINYLPNGTYLVSKTLYWAGYLFINNVALINVTVTAGSNIITASSGTFTNVQVGQSVVGTGIHPGTTVTAVTNTASITISQAAWTSFSEGNRQKRQILQGQNRELTKIKLANNLGSNFNQKAVINTGLIPAQRFRNAVRDLTIDIGSGNPLAIGLQFCAHNQGVARNLNIISSDPNKAGRAGLDLRNTNEPAPMLCKDIMIDGFDYGVWAWSGVGITLCDITVKNQLQYGIYNTSGNYGATLFMENITSINSVPAYYNIYGNNFTACVSLVNCNFHNNGNPTNAIALSTNCLAFFARGLNISDYATAIQNTADGTNLTGNISNYEYYTGMLGTGTNTSQTTNLGVPDNIALPIEPTPVVTWEQDFSKWVCPQDVGGVISSTVDQSTFIQAAIDIPGKNTIYFPRGTYLINNNIYIRGDIKRFIGCEASLTGIGKIIVGDGSSNTVIIERFDGLAGNQIQHLTSRTLIISSVTSNTDNVRTYTNISDDLTTIGTGKIFCEDFVTDSIEMIGNRGFFRQFNPETGSSPDKLILRNSAWLFCVGMKTEKNPTPIRLETNSRFDGSCFFYSTSTNEPAKVEPLVELTDAEVSLTFTESVNNNKPFLANVIEERAGQVKILYKSSSGTTGESVALTTVRRLPSDDININDISPGFVDLVIENGSIVVGDVNNAWNENLELKYRTQQSAIAIHLADFRNSKIQYNQFNGMLSIWNSKSSNILIQYNQWDYEKSDSTGYCIGLHDTGLKVQFNIFKNYGYAFRNVLNIIPGAYVDNTNMPSPTINNNIFCRPYLNSVAQFGGNKFTSFPFNFYNNTVILNSSYSAFKFSYGFNNSSAISSTTEATNVYSKFQNNIFICNSESVGSTGLATGSVTISYNAFQNTTVIGANTLNVPVDFESTNPSTNVWEYKLRSTSILINAGIPITDITPISAVSIGALQYGNPWTITQPGKFKNTMNVLPEYEILATLTSDNNQNILPTIMNMTATKLNSITFPDYQRLETQFKSGETFAQRTSFLSNGMVLSITQKMNHEELESLLNFYNSVGGTLNSFVLPEEFYKLPQIIQNRIYNLNAIQKWKFEKPPIVSPIVASFLRGWYQIEISLISVIR